MILSKMSNFDQHHLHLMPELGLFYLNFVTILWSQKTKS